MELQHISPIFARVRSGRKEERKEGRKEKGRKGKKEGRKSLTYPYNYQGMRDRTDRSSGR